MKRFRTVTIITLTAIAIMVAANVVYLHGLYVSIKEQSIISATECLRRADILDIISRLKQTSKGNDDSFIRLTLLVEGEKSPDGSYSYPNILQKMDQTMSSYFHLVDSITPDMPGKDNSTFEQVYRKELLSVSMNPKTVIIEDGLRRKAPDGSLWKIEISDVGGRPVVGAFISPLTGYIFQKMAGIIVTSSLILLLMSFLIWYLLHWVGKLRSIEQMKEDFTHNMTHELKTPVAVAYAAADSMLRYYDQSDEARNRKFLGIIMQRLSFLSGMIENILSMSMERFKTMKINKEQVRLRAIAEEVAGMIEMKAEKPVNIEIEIGESDAVITDPRHFGNVLANLLDNALKYSSDEVNIKIYGDSSHLSVQDNGIGISPKNLPFIFDKFFRITEGDRYEVGGYGLGLYYVRKIIEMQGWSIQVESQENKGTVFTINFTGNEKR